MSLDQSDLRTGHAQHSDAPRTSFWKSKAGIVTCGFLLLGDFYLLTEHWVHALGVLPYLLILACPLMHLFMHKGHGSHGGHGRHETTKPTPDSGADA
jgi:uncharacterized protein (DUF983 family)